MLQPELFDDLQNQQRPRNGLFASFPGRFLRLKVAYEDVLFAGLGLVLVLLAGFCLGVERGKRLAPPQIARELLEVGTSEAIGEVPTSGVGETVRAAPMIPTSVPPAFPDLPDAREPEGSYAVQLASYVGAQSAQSESQRLARRGIKCQVLKQRNYYELRAVGFSSRKEAEKAVGSFRKTYRDAFIKRLSSKGK